MKKTIRSGRHTRPISLATWTEMTEAGTLTDQFLQSRGYVICFDHDPSSTPDGDDNQCPVERDFNTEIRCGSLLVLGGA